MWGCGGDVVAGLVGDGVGGVEIGGERRGRAWKRAV